MPDIIWSQNDIFEKGIKMKSNVIDRCSHPEHVDGESCLNKSAVCCSKDCSCCNGVGLRFVSNTTGEPIYGSKAYINLGIEQGLVERIEISRGGYWETVTMEDWIKSGARYEYWSALEEY